MAIPYDVAVRLSAVNGLSPVIATLAKEFAGLGARVKDIEGGWTRIKTVMLGVAAVAGSVELGKGMTKVLDAGGELVKQQTLLGNMGVSAAEIAETSAKAQLATHEIIGTTIAENIKGMREMMGVMPNLKEAQDKYIPTMRAAKVLESLTGTPADQSLQTLAKAIELRGGGTDPKTGKLDPERFEREAEAAVRAIIASGGLVNAQKLLMNMQQAGPMAKAVDSADTYYKGILTAMMDMGGARSGTALTAVGRQLLGGKMGKSTAEEMQRIGILKEGMWHPSGTGTYVKPGGLVGEDILKDSNKGVSAWFNQVLLPAFKNLGLTSNADIQQELYRVFGTETARRLAGLYIQNGAQVERDAKLYDNALGGQAYANIAGGDLGANEKGLTDAFTSLMQALGAPFVKPAIEALHSITDGVNSLGGVFLAHPDLAAGIDKLLIGATVGLAAFGGAAVLAGLAAFAGGGVAAAGIAGIVVGVGALAALNWEGAASAMKGTAAAVSDFFKSVTPNVGGGSNVGGFRAPAGPIHPSSYTPPPAPAKREQTAMMHVHFHVDGQEVAAQVTKVQMADAEFQRQAPYPDGMAMWQSPDNNPAFG